MKKTAITIRTMLILLAFGIVTFQVIASVEHSYRIDLNYAGENITVLRTLVEPQPAMQNPAASQPAAWMAEVISADSRVLNRTFFAAPLTAFYDETDEETGRISRGGMIELNETTFPLYLPYFENAIEISVYDENLNHRLRIDVSSLSKTAATQPTELAENGLSPEEGKEKRDTEISREIPPAQSKKVILYVLLALGAFALWRLIRKARNKQ